MNEAKKKLVECNNVHEKLGFKREKGKDMNQKYREMSDRLRSSWYDGAIRLRH